jgi:hypothetical protein
MSAVTIMVRAILGISAVTALVAQRVNPDMVPQNSARPCIRVYLVSERSQNSMDADHGPYLARVTVEIYAESSTSCHAIAEAVKAGLENCRNQTIAGKVASIMKQASDTSAFDDVSLTYRRIMDFMVGWK